MPSALAPSPSRRRRRTLGSPGCRPRPRPPLPRPHPTHLPRQDARRDSGGCGTWAPALLAPQSLLGRDKPGPASTLRALPGNPPSLPAAAFPRRPQPILTTRRQQPSPRTATGGGLARAGVALLGSARPTAAPGAAGRGQPPHPPRCRPQPSRPGSPPRRACQPESRQSSNKYVLYPEKPLLRSKDITLGQKCQKQASLGLELHRGSNHDSMYVGSMNR